jgi:predicted TIM-barrel fold metal-dependent hydrolase
MSEGIDKLPRPLVDFHTHLFPDKLFDAIRRQFVADYGWRVIHDLYWRQTVDYLRDHGVGTIVYSNYAHKKGVARNLNDWNVRILTKLDDVYCFAAYHPDDEDGLGMASDLLDNPRIIGFKLQLLVQRFYPDDERLFPLYELVIEKKKRLLFHTGTGPVGNEFVGIAFFSRLLERYPDLPANIAHMGGLEYAQFGALLDDHSALYMDTAFSFLSGAGLLFNLGKDFLETHKGRILYGSDFPNLILPREDEINTLLNLDLSREFYNEVFRDNGLSLIRECTQNQP